VTPIQTIKAIDPKAFEATVNAARREGERWAPMGAGGIQTHDHDGWLVAILVVQRARRTRAGLTRAAHVASPET
jgi:hypothetical protein